MIHFLRSKPALTLGCSLVAVAFPHALRAQLVRETPAPAQQQFPAKQDSQTPAPPQAPRGKKRLSQEVQLTSQQAWIDAGIDIQSGEHAPITATGHPRYPDATEANGPD